MAALLVLLVGLVARFSGPELDGSDGTPGTAVAARQPSVSGYQYRVSSERYLVRGEDGSLEVQERRRESWTAPDGWAWARQTGIDPGRFIFPPSVDWQAVRESDPTQAGVARALEEALGSLSGQDRPKAEMNFVHDMLATQSLPESCLPLEYRRAITMALARHPGVVVRENARDPIGRLDATEVRLTTPEFTISIFLDSDLEYLSYAGSANSGERGLRVVTDRRHVDRIPDELLVQLGGDRVEKVIFD
ncbi:MAG: hypothetical protein L0G22_02685 [Propionibacteriaceae bacterium]|nr:hypothetical protein [Propionibacteriaceae bacterium]